MRRRTRTSAAGATPTPTPTATAPAAHILKLQVGEYDFSYSRPSDLSASADNLAVGTAVILAKEDAALLGVPYCVRTERLAISNTHCVEDIGPRRKAKAKTHLGVKIDVSVVCIVPLFDFCILRCSLDAIPASQRDLFAGLRCLTERHEMPCPGTPVSAHGYALDSETVHTTQGIVTSASGSHLPGFLSHSASIASGNSGGPLVESASGKLVGLNTATLVESEAIALAVPCWVVFATIRQQQQQRGTIEGVVRPATLGFATKPRNPSDGAVHGVRVTSVLATCCFDVMPSDIILQVSGHDIGPGGKLGATASGGAGSEILGMLLDFDEPHSEVSSALVRLAMGDDIELLVQRQGCRKPQRVVCDTRKRNAAFGMRRLYPFHEPVPHVSVGGLVLQNLSVGLLEAFDVDASTAQERDCLWQLERSRREPSAPGAVVVSFCSLNSCLCDHVQVLDRIVTINGEPVHGVHDVARILGGAEETGNQGRPKKRLRKCKTSKKDAVITLGLAVDGIVSVTRDQLKAESEVPKTAQQSCVLAL